MPEWRSLKGDPWTVGYGHCGPKVVEGYKVSSLQAEELLKKDLEIAERAVEKSIHVPLNDNQFSACVSLCYNIGQTAFAKSTLVRLVNETKYLTAADCFLDWCKSNGKRVDGLFSRRRAERELFLDNVV